jgi:hypothetical protein
MQHAEGLSVSLYRHTGDCAFSAQFEKLDAHSIRQSSEATLLH